MSDLKDTETVVLTGNLILNELSNKAFPDIKTYESVKNIDFQQLKHIDSAGLAYIAQIKSHFPELIFIGIPYKAKDLANLYGLGFIFK